MKEQGNTAFRSGRLQEAYDLYTQALNIDPNNVYTNSKLYANRATVCSKVGAVCPFHVTSVIRVCVQSSYRLTSSSLWHLIMEFDVIYLGGNIKGENLYINICVLQFHSIKCLIYSKIWLIHSIGCLICSLICQICHLESSILKVQQFWSSNVKACVTCMDGPYFS